MQRLTVLYDASCALCVRCSDWLRTQPSYVELELVSSSSELALGRFGQIPRLGEQLVVIADDGRVWAGSAAFIVCLWALRDWREWSYRLSGPAFAPLAERFFRLVSAERRRVAAFLDHRPCGAAGCDLGAARLGGGPYR